MIYSVNVIRTAYQRKNTLYSDCIPYNQSTTYILRINFSPEETIPVSDLPIILPYKHKRFLLQSNNLCCSAKKEQPKKRMSVVKEGDDEDVGIQIKASGKSNVENSANSSCASFSLASDVEKGRQPNGDVKKDN